MASGAPSSASSTPSDESSASIAKNKHAQKYSLRVTAGSSYDTTTHVVVPVNAPQTLHLNSQHMLLSVAVRIKHFTGIPTSSPPTSPYFDHPLHKSDQYSISFSFIPKVDIPGNDLIFGNDFDRPIRDRLPPGFNQAFRIAKWFIDPGLEGDPYSDKPYLYGPALSSWNILRIGEKIFQRKEEKEEQKPVGDEHIPEIAQPESETFEAGRLHQSDFGNPYLDFNDFSLKLPGFSLNVIKYVDEKTHELRYVLKNRSTDDVYAVVLLSLLFGDEQVGVSGEDCLPAGEMERGEDRSEAKVGEATEGPEGEFGYEKPPDEDDVD